MAVTLVGASALAAAVTTSTLAIPFGVTTQADDIIVVHVMNRSTDGMTVTGYTEKVPSGEVSQPTLTWVIPAMFWKRSTGGETTVTLNCPGVGTGGVYGLVTVLRGCVATGDPFDAMSPNWVIDTSTTSTTLNYPSLNTVTNGAMAVGWGFGDDDDGPITTPAGGWTEVADAETTTGNDLCIQIVHKEMATAGATGATSCTKTTGGRDIVLMYALIPASTALTATVNQSTETDTAQAIELTKRQLVTQASDAETAQVIAARRITALGQPTETDSAQAVSAARSVGVAQTTETDSALPFLVPQFIEVGQAIEADQAQSLAIRQQVGQITETDSAQSITPRHTLAIGQATETASAQAVAVAKQQTIGQVTETCTAQPIVREAFISPAIETDSALEIAPFIDTDVAPRLPLTYAGV